MSDDPPPFCVVRNIDPKDLVASAEDLPERWDEIPGLKPTGPITISGTFLAPHEAVCGLCGDVFALSPAGPIPFATVDDVPAGPICDDCAMRVLEGRPPD